MEAIELLDVIERGESSFVQFKERATDASKLSHELIAFSNTKGGVVVIGVNDKTGAINGLSFEEVEALNQLISNVATNNVKPPILVETETVSTTDGNVVIITLDEGMAKPYKDNSGMIWIKNGSDKRKVTDNNEIARLLQRSKILYADESLVQNTSIANIDLAYYKGVYAIKYNMEFEKSGVDLATSLRNQQLMREDKLTLAGLLLFGNNRQEVRPLFTIQCIAVAGVDLLSNTFLDNEYPFAGRLDEVYNKAISFIDRNIKKIPSGDSFNSPLEWEIPKNVFEELIVNALIHRDYYINSKIQIVIYSDRIEIISPGVLPNSQTIETIVSGVSIPRNPILQSIVQYMLPYKGAGTGLMRARNLYPDIKLINDAEKEQFIAIIYKSRD